MFYEPDKRDTRILPLDPFKAIVAPRPIGWFTSMSAKGEVNLAPYSFFNGINSRPNLVMFASEGRKDSVSFIEETGEFVCNLATWDLRESMNVTSARRQRDGTRRIGASAFAADQAAAGKGLPMRARMQAHQNRADGDSRPQSGRLSRGLRPSGRRAYRRPLDYRRSLGYCSDEADRPLRL